MYINIKNFNVFIHLIQVEIGPAAPESSKSNVWQYYKRYEKENPLYDKKAICNFQIDDGNVCGSVQDRSGGSTSNWIRHLISKHGINPGCKKKLLARIILYSHLQSALGPKLMF